MTPSSARAHRPGGMDMDAIVAAIGPRPPKYVGPGGTDPAFITHDKNDRNWLQRVRRAKQRKGLLNDALAAAQRDTRAGPFGSLGNPARTAAEAACQAAVSVQLEKNALNDVSISILGVHITDAKLRVAEGDSRLEQAYQDRYAEELYLYPDGADRDAVNDADEGDIDELLSIQADRVDELNALQSELIKLAIPGYGVSRLKPVGPVPQDKNGYKKWDVAMGCWLNADSTVFIQLSSNEKRQAAMQAKMMDFATICELADTDANKLLLNIGLPCGNGGWHPREGDFTSVSELRRRPAVYVASKLVFTIEVDHIFSNDAMSALGGRLECAFSGSQTFHFYRHPAYWLHVREMLAAVGYSCISRRKFEYYLRALLTKKVMSLTKLALAALKAREAEFEVLEADRRAMEQEDSRLSAERIRASLGEFRAQELRKAARYATMRDDETFVCNGHSGHQHRPGMRFNPTLDPEWDFWNATDLEAWRRDLIVNWYPRCSMCFELTGHFKIERLEEIRQMRESSLLAKMSDDDDYHCAAFVRNANYDAGKPNVNTSPWRKCGATFNPIRPSHWTEVKFNEWRRSLVCFYTISKSNYRYFDHTKMCPACFSVEYAPK